MENYMQYHLMSSVRQVRMKPGCKPTKFECLQDRISHMPNPVEHPFSHKNQSMMVTGDSVKDLDEKSVVTKHMEPEEDSFGSSEAIAPSCNYAGYVKEEPGLEHEASEKPEEWGPVKEEPLLEYETSLYQEEGSWPVLEPSEAAGLYAGHEVKSELVLGPTTLQPPDASAATVWPNTEHTPSPLAEQVITGTKQYECEICLRQFSYTSHLLIHKQIHAGERHGPDFSPKQLRQRSLHTKEKLKCDVCGKRFTQKRRLVIHKRVHASKKPYQCETCSKQFAYKCSLVRHERCHVEQYECDSCQMKFSCKASVELHVRGHAAHPCPICGAPFARREALRRHAAGHIHAPPSPAARGSQAETGGAPRLRACSVRLERLAPADRRPHSGELPRDHTKPRGLACTAVAVLSGSVPNVAPREKCSATISTTERSEAVGSSQRSSDDIQSSNSFDGQIPSASIVFHDHCYTGQNFLCHICLRLYSDTDRDEKRHECEKCFKRFSCKYCLTYHIRTHTQVRNILKRYLLLRQSTTNT